jgi:hypothetical protein
MDLNELKTAHEEARRAVVEHDRKCQTCDLSWALCDEGRRLVEMRRRAWNAYNAARGGDLGPPDPPRHPKHRPVA